MKNWNPLRVGMIATGLLLVAVVLPGLAQDDKKTRLKPGVGKKIDPDFEPLKKTPLGKGALAKAKIDANQIIAHKRPPKKFIPFTRKDLKDPKTGKQPAPGAVLTLGNGRKVTEEKYLKAINKVEEWSVKRGVSLRDPEKRVTIQELAVDKNRLQIQAKALSGTLAKADPKATLHTSPKLLEQEHAAAAKTAKLAFGIKGPLKDIGGIPLQPVSTVRTFDKSVGSSNFGGSVKAQLTMKGDAFGVSISAEGRATGSLLGHSKDLVLASASVTAPRSGGLNAKFKVSTLGIDQIVLDKTEPSSWTKTDTFSRSLPDALRVEHNFFIGPVPVSVEVGIKGSAKMPYFVGLHPGSSTAWMIPEITSSVYAQAAVDAEVDLFLIEAGVEAGVEVQMTLLDNKLVVAGGIDQGKDSKGTFVKEWYTSRNDLKALAGRLLAYVQFDVSFLGVPIGSKRFDHVFWSFGGFNSVLTPFSGGETRYLQPLTLIQAK